MYQIPVTNQPQQSFQCMVPVGEETKTFDLYLEYNSVAEYWMLTISDADTEQELITALPLLSGEFPSANLLEQFDFLDIGKAVIVSVGGDTAQNPTDETLGTEHVLVWSD